MNFTLQGTNLELSDEIRSFVNEKVDDCMRAFGDMNLDPVHLDIELELTTRRHPQEREDEQLFRSEANLTVPGRMIRVEESAPDLEQAVVQMKHTLTREIRQWQDRMKDDERRGAREVKRTFGLASAEPPEGKADSLETGAEIIAGGDPGVDWDQEEERVQRSAVELIRDDEWVKPAREQATDSQENGHKGQ